MEERILEPKELKNCVHTVCTTQRTFGSSKTVNDNGAQQSSSLFVKKLICFPKKSQKHFKVRKIEKTFKKQLPEPSISTFPSPPPLPV